MSRTAAPLQESDLIFSSATNEIKQALGGLRRFNLSIKNRLHSIHHDSKFVTSVADYYRLPLVANERCGSWYIPPSRKVASAYFKSTDGHHGQWSFSLRRLNLQIIDTLAEHGGCVIVDSTRRGKSMPDALSKTAPIWAAVLNKLIFPDRDTGLQLPTEVVGESEQSQIQSLLPSFVAQLDQLQLDVASLRAKLNDKPITITWATHNSTKVSLTGPPEPQCIQPNTVVLCTASSRSSSIEATGHYVQGAADDAESWALGLTPVIYWQHLDTLLRTAEDDLPQLIQEFVSIDASNHSQEELQQHAAAPVCIRPTTAIYIANNESSKDCSGGFQCIIRCSEAATGPADASPGPQILDLELSSGKRGSRQLRTQLSKLCDQASPLRKLETASRILCVGSDDYDLSTGIALAVSCLVCNDSGELDPGRLDSFAKGDVSINKSIIRLRLSWIMVSMPQARPSRATLQSVNAFLMTR